MLVPHLAASGDTPTWISAICAIVALLAAFVAAWAGIKASRSAADAVKVGKQQLEAAIRPELSDAGPPSTNVLSSDVEVRFKVCNVGTGVAQIESYGVRESLGEPSRRATYGTEGFLIAPQGSRGFELVVGKVDHPWFDAVISTRADWAFDVDYCDAQGGQTATVIFGVTADGGAGWSLTQQRRR